MDPADEEAVEASARSGAWENLPTRRLARLRGTTRGSGKRSARSPGLGASATTSSPGVPVLPPWGLVQRLPPGALRRATGWMRTSAAVCRWVAAWWGRRPAPLAVEQRNLEMVFEQHLRGAFLKRQLIAGVRYQF